MAPVGLHHPIHTSGLHCTPWFTPPGLHYRAGPPGGALSRDRPSTAQSRVLEAFLGNMVRAPGVQQEPRASEAKEGAWRDCWGPRLTAPSAILARTAQGRLQRSEDPLTRRGFYPHGTFSGTPRSGSVGSRP